MQQPELQLPTADRGDWIETFSGKAFYPFNPTIEEVKFMDIAHALSQINRYAGHLKEPWSVAQHCLLVAGLMGNPYYTLPGMGNERARLLGLLHDFHEAYLGEIIGPVKRTIKQQPGMKEWWMGVEHELDRCIYAKAGLQMPDEAEKKVIKYYDHYALVLETKTLLPFHGRTYAHHFINILEKQHDMGLLKIHSPKYGVMLFEYLQGLSDVEGALMQELTRLGVNLW